MALKAAAQRKTFKGKYRGPERFKGDKAAIAAWKAEKAGNPNPGMATEPAMTFLGDVNHPTNTAVKPTTPGLPATDFTLPEGATSTMATPGNKTTNLANKTYRGKYAGKDKYKGIAQKGMHKGKYIGLESRKGAAKPTTLLDTEQAVADALAKRKKFVQ